MERFVTVYSYDDTGLFMGETKAQKDKNGNVMMPANATQIEPLESIEGFDIFWNEDNKTWDYIEIQQVEEETEEETEELTYAQKRLAEYPFLGDQLDAIFKGFKALEESGQELPEDTLTWLSDVQAVKDRYPVE